MDCTYRERTPNGSLYACTLLAGHRGRHETSNQVRGPLVFTEHATGVREVYDAVVYMRDHPDVIILTCGNCRRSWDASHASAWTPSLSGRCPFEYEHDNEEEDIL